MKKETMDDFMLRGGQITLCPISLEKFDYSAKYKHDKQLSALRILLKTLTNQKDKEKVESAITTRINILKSVV